MPAVHTPTEMPALGDPERTTPDGPAGGRGLNIAHECVDRHARHGAERVALRLIHGRRHTTLTYGELRDATNRMANVLASCGVRRGDLVAVLLGAGPDLPVVLFGAAKLGATGCPLATGAGAGAVQRRIDALGARVLVTTAARYTRHVAAARDRLPMLERVLVVGEDAPAGTTALAPLARAASDRFEVARTRAEEPAFVHFTAGTSAEPHPVVHPHALVGAWCATATLALDLHADDVAWCTAEPGSVAFTAYGLAAPLALGAAAVIDDGAVDADRWYDLLRDERVTVWYTTACALRTLRRAGVGLAREHRVRRLRVAASTGEPLDAATAAWGAEAFGVPVRDTWWQTETGAITVAQPLDGVRLGALGIPVPGVVAAVARCGPGGSAGHSPDGGIVAVATGETGELVVRCPWPLPEADLDADGWRHTGDLVHRDEHGWLWFDGRADEVVHAARGVVGAFAVERAVLDHPAVAQAAAAPRADGSAVFVVLRRGQGASAALRREILDALRARLGTAVPVVSVTIVDRLPQTPAGRIARGRLS